MVCYNVNIILAHDPIFQLDVCSILLKHPSRGQRQYTMCPGRKRVGFAETPLTGTATVHPCSTSCIPKFEETPLTGTATVHSQVLVRVSGPAGNTPHGDSDSTLIDAGQVVVMQ